jgi:AcrR family transcriptional regulator
MSPKPDVSEERRQQILDAAETVFGERGFAQARMDDIVSEAGLSKGALYWYYKSKNAIILALLDRVFGREFEKAEALVEAPGTASQRLTEFVQSTLHDIAGMRHLLPIAYEFVALAARQNEVRAAIGDYYQRYQSLLARIIRQGIEAGEFRQQDPEEAAMLIIGLAEGLALLWFVAPDWIDLKEQGDRPMRALLEGLAIGDHLQSN